jgi:hypothetical protein
MNSSRILGIMGLLLIPFIGLGHYATGTEISFAIYYLPPLATAGWFGGRVFCCFVGIETAIVWFAADEARMAQLSDPAIHYWSMLVRLLIYTVVAVLFALLRERRDELELAVQLKTRVCNRKLPNVLGPNARFWKYLIVNSSELLMTCTTDWDSSSPR